MNPLEWTEHLALAEIVADNAISTAISYSQFYINTSEHPIALSTFLGMYKTSQVVAM